MKYTLEFKDIHELASCFGCDELYSREGWEALENYLLNVQEWDSSYITENIGNFHETYLEISASKYLAQAVPTIRRLPNGYISNEFILERLKERGYIVDTYKVKGRQALMCMYPGEDETYEHPTEEVCREIEQEWAERRSQYLQQEEKENWDNCGADTAHLKIRTEDEENDPRYE